MVSNTGNTNGQPQQTDQNQILVPGAEGMEILFKKYYDRLLYFAWQYIHEKETAKDLVQEAFLKYWNQHREISADETQIRNYLYVTVKNACLKYLRHLKVVDKYHSQLDDEPVEERTMINTMIRAEIYQAIESLPASCRQISKMGYLEGMKNQEIAGLLGISVNTVKTQKQRALQLLRLRLNPETFLALLLICRFFNN